MTSSRLTTNIETEVARLGDLDRQGLIDLWIKTYQHSPPKAASRKLLIRSAAYNAQAKVYGGLRRNLRRQLMQIASGGKASNLVGDRRHQLKPGVRLIREWNGITHTVEVVEGGFTWNGDVYRSLSAVATAITGARWSGPRFFQL